MSSLEETSVDELRKLWVRAYEDLEALREQKCKTPEVDMSNQSWWNAVKVEETIRGIYHEKAIALFAALPMAAKVLMTYNTRGENTDGGSKSQFGNRRNTFHIVPDKPFTQGAFHRGQGQPLCKEMKVKPWVGAGWSMNGRENRPDCHACLVRAEKIIAAKVKA